MTIRNAAIALTTAASITLGTFGPTQAAPLVPNAPAGVETQITEVGGRHRHGRRHHRRHRHGQAAAFGALAGIALGAAIASNAGRRCFVEEVRVWRPRLGAYVIREREVCR